MRRSRKTRETPTSAENGAALSAARTAWRATRVATSSKLQRALQVATEASGSVVIFSQFLVPIRVLATALSEAGVACAIIEGGTACEKRRALMDEFQAGRTKVQEHKKDVSK